MMLSQKCMRTVRKIVKPTSVKGDLSHTKRCFNNQLVEIMTMNRRLRGLALLLAFMCATSATWAICETERQNYIDAGVADQREACGRNWGGGDKICTEGETVARFSKFTAEAFDWVKTLVGDERQKNLNRIIPEEKDFLDQFAKNPRSSKSKLFAAERTHIICLIKNTSGQSAGSAFNRQSDAQINPSSSQAQQSQVAQAQQTAQQTQSRADQQRQGKRKTNDPAAQAHECVAIDQAGSGNYGAFKNTCGYKVNFTTCNYKPRTIQGGFNWSADFDCEKNQFGLHTPDAGRSVAAHNRNTEMVYWFACKAPATPVDAAFVVGKGIEARCHN
jgi:hypothetical protein